MNPETECIEAHSWWGVGIHREEIWSWFDQRYSKGIATCCTEVPRIMYRRQSGSMD